MPGVARKSGADAVNTVHNAVGKGCNVAPTTTATDQGSDDVFVNGIGVVRESDAVARHVFPGCSTHAPGLATFSGNVYVNGKRIGRLNDTYGCGARITTSSSNVFAN
jgi:uncharacterized Zn-binding protein involved in type VI secretion